MAKIVYEDEIQEVFDLIENILEVLKQEDVLPTTAMAADLEDRLGVGIWDEDNDELVRVRPTCPVCRETLFVDLWRQEFYCKKCAVELPKAKAIAVVKDFLHTALKELTSSLGEVFDLFLVLRQFDNEIELPEEDGNAT